LDFTLFRLKSTKQTIAVIESGAYCQGDSDYYYTCYFDDKGNAIYWNSQESEYNPELQYFFKDGKKVLEANNSPTTNGPSEFTVSVLSDTATLHVSEFESMFETYEEKMAQRIDGLEKYRSEGGLSTNEDEEALATIEALSIELNKDFSYIDRVAFEKPGIPSDENYYQILLINGINVKVHSEASLDSEVVSFVSFFSNRLVVDALGHEDTIEPYGTHRWYKVRFIPTGQDEVQKGWIYGAFVMGDI
jgi:hypothetical protein